MKKMLSMMLCLFMIIGLMPANMTFAAEQKKPGLYTEEDHYLYAFLGDEITLNTKVCPYRYSYTDDSSIFEKNIDWSSKYTVQWFISSPTKGGDEKLTPIKGANSPKLTTKVTKNMINIDWERRQEIQDDNEPDHCIVEGLFKKGETKLDEAHMLFQDRFEINLLGSTIDYNKDYTYSHQWFESQETAKGTNMNVTLIPPVDGTYVFSWKAGTKGIIPAIEVIDIVNHVDVAGEDDFIEVKGSTYKLSLKKGHIYQVRLRNHSTTGTWTDGKEYYTFKITAPKYHIHSFAKTYTIDQEATIDRAGSKSIHCTGCKERKNVTTIPRISKLTIKKGKTAIIPTSVKASKWKSSKKKVVKVSSKGTIKGMKKGKATITATIKGKKYTCKVTVKK